MISSCELAILSRTSTPPSTKYVYIVALRIDFPGNYNNLLFHCNHRRYADYLFARLIEYGKYKHVGCRDKDAIERVRCHENPLYSGRFY